MKPRTLTILGAAALLGVALPGLAGTPTGYFGPEEDQEYVDPETLLVYEVQNDLLVPLRVASDASGFFVVDAYSFGQRPDPATGHTSPCRMAYCVSVDVAVANPRQYWHHVELVVADACGGWSEPYSFSGLWAHHNPPALSFDCPFGMVEAYLYFDGRLMDQDRLFV